MPQYTNELKDILNNVHLCIHRAKTDTMPLHWSLPPRTIFDHELIYVEAGSVRIILGEEEYCAEQNDVILIPPGIVHSFFTYGNTRWTQPHIHFDFTYNEKEKEPYVSFEVIGKNHPDYCMMRKNYYEKLGLPYIVHAKNSFVPQKIKNLIYKIIRLQISNNPYDILLSKNYLTEIIVLLLQETHPLEEYEDKHQRIYIICDLIMEQQLTTFFNLSEIAENLNYSPNYISTIYKRYCGITPAKRYEELKMTKAREYVLQKNISITEIADTLGFISINDFSRAFKRNFGLSPLQYRKSKELDEKGAPLE